MGDDKGKGKDEGKEKKKPPSKNKFVTISKDEPKKEESTHEIPSKHSNPQQQQPQQQQLKASSLTDVPPAQPTKSEITQTSSLNGQKFPVPAIIRFSTGSASGFGASSTGSRQSAGGPVPLLLANPPPQVVRTYSGRHRQSGLFSKDDLSIDVSLTASEKFQQFGHGGSANYLLGITSASSGGGEGRDEKRHPRSMAGSSIGSSSIGSELFVDGLNAEGRKHLYKPFRRKWRRFRRKYKGCLFALISSLTSSLASYFVKSLTKGKGHQYNPAYCLLWRYFGVLFPGLFIVMYYRFIQKEMVFDTVWPLKKRENVKRFFLSNARAIVDVVAVFLNYQAFQYLLQSETSTILNSKPIVVQLLAHYTLGEPWGVVPIVMSFIAALGVVVMSKPPFLQPQENSANTHESFIKERFPGIMYSISSMILSSVVYCILRYLKDVHYSVFSLFIGTAGLIFGLGMTFGLHVFVIPNNGRDWAYFSAVAVLVCFSSISIVIALQNEEAFVVSLVRSCDVIFSFIWEMCIDQKFPDWYGGAGGSIVMFCVFVIFFRKYLTHQDPESKIYKRFEFLTK